ncbi:MAG TPA: FadD3 family acyl-CoA ligase [Pseudonocardiaceae bacterium]|nr:FadD3 family acyl-CoA ligase [Pseudonocardiaceae bacterium]
MHSSAPPRTVPAALDAAADRFGTAEALVDESGARPVRLSWLELRAETRVAAGALLADGVRPGDRVAICCPNTWHWVVAALGALSIGAQLVPLNTRFTARETLDILTRTSARALVITGPFLGRDRLAELRACAGPNLPGTVIEAPWTDLTDRARDVPAAELDARAAAVDADQISDILFTSGTTGRSKGALSAHRQTIAVAEAWANRGELGPGDRYLVINPFLHSFGYKAGLVACVLRGATIVPQPVFDVAHTIDLVEDERITVLPGPPTIYQSILDSPDRAGRDLSSLRLAVTGAATVPVALIRRMRRELTFDTVLTAYGLTEAVVATMCRPEDDAETVAHTCGRATAGFELRVDSIGEVLLRGPNVTLGYLDDPAATAQAIDRDGWLHTGDVGTVDAAGYLRITDRIKDMYISGGFNVYPAEVEQVLASLPGVAECAVVGVPDDRLGEVGRAYLVAGPDHGLDAAEVLAFCRERLANYKVPRQVRLRDALPRNASGKILKRELREER